MITIESGALITIVVGIFCTIVSSVVTWFFSKRHYSKTGVPATDRDVELQKVGLKHQSEILVLLIGIGAILILGVFTMMLIFFANN